MRHSVRKSLLDKADLHRGCFMVEMRLGIYRHTHRKPCLLKSCHHLAGSFWAAWSLVDVLALKRGNFSEAQAVTSKVEAQVMVKSAEFYCLF
jgi:hypothetical protein